MFQVDMGTAPVRSPRLDPRYASFNLSIRRSKIHRYGVYAEERIPPRRKVIEYTGERINRLEAKRRDNESLTYLFAVDPYWTIDGASGGSGAEIINHSCEPSLISRVVKGHILYMSLRVIEPGEELTIDYNFPRSKKLTPCSCGASTCLGNMEKVRVKKTG
jgi:SET domain-containing protein